MRRRGRSEEEEEEIKNGRWGFTYASEDRERRAEEKGVESLGRLGRVGAELKVRVGACRALRSKPGRVLLTRRPSVSIDWVRNRVGAKRFVLLI